MIATLALIAALPLLSLGASVVIVARQLSTLPPGEPPRPRAHPAALPPAGGAITRNTGPDHPHPIPTTRGLARRKRHG